ncbi:MAG: tRNA lysidine(34) synthetase TilS [Acidobacteriota bacterium]
MDVLSTFIRTVRRFDLLRDNDRVVVAVSGGADSTALLHLLRDWRGLSLRLAVAHLDHGQRGADGREDARFVAELARASDLPFFEGHLTPASRRPEEDLRRGRLAFLAEVAGKWGATAVAVGHQRDDQAETLLLNLLRGAGGHGLGGLPPVASLTLGPARLVRPLIALPRLCLERWLTEKGRAWREDPTNADPGYLRNRVRRELIPLLEDLRPGAGATIARAAGLLRSDEDFLLELATAGDDEVVFGDGVARLDAVALRRMARPLSRRVLRRAAATLDRRTRAGGEMAGHADWIPGAEQVDAVLDRVRDRAAGEIDLGRNRVARVTRTQVEILPRRRHG